MESRSGPDRGLNLPRFGFGAAPIGNMHAPMSDEEAVATVLAALEAGQTYCDVAPLYGHGLAERRLGEALARTAITNALVSTKVGRLLEPCARGEEESGIYKDTPPVSVVFDYSYDGVMRSFEASRERIGQRIDILYVHDVDAATHGSREGSEARIRELVDAGGWRALDELRSAGEVRAIGAGVNEWEPCDRLLDLADPDLFLLAGRYTLLEQEPLDRLMPRCQERGVGLVIGGVFNSGILATGAVKGAYYNYAPAPEPILQRVAAMSAVCESHGVPLAAAALQFPLHHPVVRNVLIGARTPAEIARNAELAEIAIPPVLWAELKQSGLLREDAPC
ncbi:MAG: aldo/keto reductase [Erythrobacter sp.]|uniref:aldo/keto reductase n=1 Tax=Erythrobacter sp. TaxID=1042 RepID=UPI002611AFA4|nr:aldo/keto reductase [Erythrobacter sp.]MDJ0978133.1 aldo/keto reductase [Erythrobacter sp.]